MRRLNIRLLALVLILVFTQKLGLRLWMHTWLHETRSLTASKVPSVDKLQTNCDCIDDFLMPLTGSQIIELIPPVQSFYFLATAGTTRLAEADKHFSSLRGPPARPAHS